MNKPQKDSGEAREPAVTESRWQIPFLRSREAGARQLCWLIGTRVVEPRGKARGSSGRETAHGQGPCCPLNVQAGRGVLWLPPAGRGRAPPFTAPWPLLPASPPPYRHGVLPVTPRTHPEPQIHSGGRSGPSSAVVANLFLLPLSPCRHEVSHDRGPARGPPPPSLLLSCCSRLLRPFPGYRRSVTSSGEPPRLTYPNLPGPLS